MPPKSNSVRRSYSLGSSFHNPASDGTFPHADSESSSLERELKKPTLESKRKGLKKQMATYVDKRCQLVLELKVSRPARIYLRCSVSDGLLVVLGFDDESFPTSNDYNRDPTPAPSSRGRSSCYGDLFLGTRPGNERKEGSLRRRYAVL